VRTSIAVFEAVERFGSVGALVLRIGERVLIAIGFSGARGGFALGRLRLFGRSRDLVRRAAVRLGSVRARARLVGAGVLLIVNAVAVVVGIGASIFILEAVLVLGLVGALVLRVGDAVVVVVQVGTAVGILEAVLVLGEVLALIHVVGDAVAVDVVVA